METNTLKKIAGITLVAGTLLFGMASCKKSNSQSVNGNLSATISGTTFNPFNVTAYDNSNLIIIDGYQGLPGGDTATIELGVSDYIKVDSAMIWDSGTGLDIDYSDYNGQFSYDVFAYGSHGTYTVTTLDKTNKKIAGTFSGVVYNASGSDSIVITNGRFNTPYTTQ